MNERYVGQYARKTPQVPNYTGNTTRITPLKHVKATQTFTLCGPSQNNERLILSAVHMHTSFLVSSQKSKMSNTGLTAHVHKWMCCPDLIGKKIKK